MNVRHNRRKMVMLGIPVALVVLLLIVAAVGALVGGRGGTASTKLATVAGERTSSVGGQPPYGAAGVVAADADGGFATDKSADASSPVTSTLAYGPDPLDPARFLVRTGDMTIFVADGKVPEAAARVTSLATGMNGYIVSSQITLTRDGDRPFASITVKVPSRSYDQAIARFSQLGTVETLNTSTEDVTGEYVDTQARLRHYRAVERRLLGFLSKTTTIGEALTVQARIDATQLKVEQLSGQIKALHNQVVYGTLTVGITEPSEKRQADKHENRFVAALGDSWNLIVGGFAAIIVGVGAVLPFAVLLAGLGLLVWVGIRAAGRLRRHTAPAA
jgi:hypothetical protein